MLKLSREFYMPKSDSLTQVNSEGTDAAVFTYSDYNKLFAIGFHGKASKPDFHNSFRSEEQRSQHIARYIEGRKLTADYRAKCKAERSTDHTLKVGDILVSSWGYDQTNIDFYQVIRVVSSKSVEIRAICAESGPQDGFMTAHCKAKKDAFKGKPMIKRANHTNSVKIASYASASPWDGKAERYSWYA